MKILLDMVGCRLNQSEIEKFAHQLRVAGHKIVSNPAEADMAIVNTCTVTASAAADSRKVIRRISSGGCKNIVATGCLSTIDPNQVMQLPSVVELIPNTMKDGWVERGIDHGESETELNLVRVPLPGKNKRTRAFIKIQDGCDNYCTFCITRIARGASRSVAKQNIFDDITYALSGGVKEIVLTGVNLGSWGKDLENVNNLPVLINEILNSFTIPRLRLSSIEPWDIDDALLNILHHSSFCNHFHIPLQSGCDKTLKRMGRRISSSQFRNLVDRIRALDENTAITTDIIVGFPGETKDEFKESLDFIRDIQFSGGHVFRYSPRPGTPAFQLTNTVQESLVKDRSKIVRDLIAGDHMKFMKSNSGKDVNVLWERSDQLSDSEFQLIGLTRNYISVVSRSSENYENELSHVRLNDFDKKHMLGEIIS